MSFVPRCNTLSQACTFKATVLKMCFELPSSHGKEIMLHNLVEIWKQKNTLKKLRNLTPNDRTMMVSS
jgi:hypothetical protein